jgi:hypothetical protein
MINVLEPASLVNGLNKSNALLALVDKSLGIATETYTHVAIRKVKTRARENASTGLKALTLIDRYVPMRMLVP